MNAKISNGLRHFFHILSNIRPTYWICLYVAFVPVFALVYWALPDGQFRIPDNAGTDFGSWLYYSIVTITTLGFGDYTPAHGWAQAVTAVEVMVGLINMGLFLNAVGSMKSEIDVDSALEQQRRLHEATETEKLRKNIPIVTHKLNRFLAFCYAVTTPESERSKRQEYDPDFSFQDMRDLYQPSGLPTDFSVCPAVHGLIRCSHDASLFLDSMQQRIDLTLWPDLLQDCFAFVANTELFASEEMLLYRVPSVEDRDHPLAEEEISERIASWKGELRLQKGGKLNPVIDLYHYIKTNADLARRIETVLTRIVSA